MKFDYSKLQSTRMQQARIKHDICGKPMLDIKEDNHLMQFTFYGIILDIL